MRTSNQRVKKAEEKEVVSKAQQINKTSHMHVDRYVNAYRV